MQQLMQPSPDWHWCTAETPTMPARCQGNCLRDVYRLLKERMCRLQPIGSIHGADKFLNVHCNGASATAGMNTIVATWVRPLRWGGRLPQAKPPGGFGGAGVCWGGWIGTLVPQGQGGHEDNKIFDQQSGPVGMCNQPNCCGCCVYCCCCFYCCNPCYGVPTIYCHC